MRNITLCLVGSLLLLSVTSCQKSSTPAAKSRTELISSSGWKVTKEEYKVGTGPWLDDTGSYAACELDNVYLIKSNGTYEQNEGATKCSPADPQIIETGTWVFLVNETQLKVTSTGSPSSDTFSIDQLDNNTIILSSSEIIGAITYYYRTTFKH